MTDAKGKFTYAYPRPAVTVDLVAFTVRKSQLHVLLIQRKSPPFEGQWALPGGFMEMQENPHAAVIREVQEETGLLVDGDLFELGFFGEVGRDPRGRTISLVHLCLVQAPAPDPVGRDDAAEAAWVPVESLEVKGQLAFDHDLILNNSLAWLDHFLDEPSHLQSLLPAKFDSKDVETVFEIGGYSTENVHEWVDEMLQEKLIAKRPRTKNMFENLGEVTTMTRADVTP
jgi:8-oxo-dGTP diphosphatase